MADFIAKPTLEFTQSNIGEHAFSSQFLDGVFIYDPEGNLVWGKKYDAATGQSSSYEHLLPDISRILQQATRLSVDEISPSVRYMGVEDEPYLAATARGCDSDG